MASDFPNVPNYYPDHPSLLRTIIRVVKNIMQGKTNNNYTVTLTANSATTTVPTPKDTFGPSSVFLFMPQTVNAATEFGAGVMYVSSRDVDNNQFIITHTNNATTDRIFGYVIVG